MLKFRVVAFSNLLSLVLGAYQILFPALMTSGVHAQSGAKNEQKVTATIALPGVQVETLNPYAHSTTQIYPTWKHVIEPLIEWSWSKKQTRRPRDRSDEIPSVARTPASDGGHPSRM